MESLRKIGSKLNLRRKKKTIINQTSDPVLEYPIDEQGWPTYDPSAYETFKESSKLVLKSRDERMNQYAGLPPRTLSGVSREILEWNEPSEYDEDVNSSTKTEGRADLGNSFLRSTYGAIHLPLFGPQYGISQLSHTNEQDLPARNPTITRMETLPSYDVMRRNADANLERAYLENLEPANVYQTQADPPTAPSIEPFVPSATSPTSCIICTENFSETVRPPGWISLACLHEPSVCSSCLAKCIKSDLETKIWNQIQCPECRTLLIYEDIQRLADLATFARYEDLSFRSAVGSDDNFVWCRGCDFGQQHEGGALQPIIRCLNCGSRSCFVHQAAWHERLTCEEYDEMLRDPDGFQSSRSREDEAIDLAREMQDQEAERLARQTSLRDKQAEQNRQRQRHADARRRAKAEQEAEKARRQLEQQRAKKQLEQERARIKAELKRKVEEEKLSLAKIQKTTKQCPKCHRPIEKNEGCDHMTWY
ncbi:hypothetical protein VE03_02421 [Pseudogymnoascus sp. 23342-1-I1]|nr:hypothetical protein VE03_02421 [Pseudogymnoascus sp. 23342-1-I1]